MYCEFITIPYFCLLILYYFIELTLNPPEGIIAGPINEDNFFEWEALIMWVNEVCVCVFVCVCVCVCVCVLDSELVPRNLESSKLILNGIFIVTVNKHVHCIHV